MRYKYDYNDACKLIIGMLMFWEDTYKDSRMNFIISECIIGAFNFFGMIVGEHLKVKYISVQDGRQKRYYSYFSLKEGYNSVEFNALNKEETIVSDEEIKNAEKYVSEYINNQKHPPYIYIKESATKQIGKTLWLYLKKLRKISLLWEKKFNNKFNTKTYKGRGILFEPIKEALRSKAINKYFNPPDYNESYVLFPLHYQPEASTCVFARKYENQLFFIEQLSKSIPAGLQIYVKEHVVRQGHRPLDFYKSIKKYPNIKLIGPNYSGHELIKNSEFVVCLTSTMGFEALMYGKTVFVCGNCFYENFSGAIKMKDVFDEKNKFISPPAQDREIYIRQMAYYFRVTHLCVVTEMPMRYEEPCELERVRKQTIEELMSFINKIQNGDIT